MSILETLDDEIVLANHYLWGISFIFIIGLGIVFTVKLRGLQIIRIRETARLSLSGINEEKKTSKISSFEAFCIGMGARIGVGNIAGVATAIVTGGPGAVFWMWIFAIIGAASSFMESTLAQIYKEKKEDGHYYGGPAYYAEKGLGSKKLGIFTALLLIAAFGMGYICVQSCNASSALTGAFKFDYNNYVFAAIIAGIAGIVIFRGVKGAANFSTKIVPFMTIAWMTFATAAICMNLEGVPNAFCMIFKYAFDVPALIGGGLGAVIATGLKRGIFSNEAGLGSVANVAAAADVKHPVTQGLIQSFGVLVGTLGVCTFTAIVVLSYGNFEEVMSLNEKGANLVQTIVANGFGTDVTDYIIAGFMFVFAFTSLIGYYTMSESNARYIKDDKRTIFLVRILVISVTFISATCTDVTLSDSFSDTFMAVMATVNMTIIALLSRRVFEAYADYRKQKREGIEQPVFHKSALSDANGVTEWDDQP